MKSWRVSDDVGNTRNNWAELIYPIPDDAPKREKKPKRAKPKKGPPPQGLFDWSSKTFRNTRSAQLNSRNCFRVLLRVQSSNA